MVSSSSLTVLSSLLTVLSSLLTVSSSLLTFLSSMLTLSLSSADLSSFVENISSSLPYLSSLSLADLSSASDVSIASSSPSFSCLLVPNPISLKAAAFNSLRAARLSATAFSLVVFSVLSKESDLINLKLSSSSTFFAFVSSEASAMSIFFRSLKVVDSRLARTDSGSSASNSESQGSELIALFFSDDVGGEGKAPPFLLGEVRVGEGEGPLKIASLIFSSSSFVVISITGDFLAKLFLCLSRAPFTVISLGGLIPLMFLISAGFLAARSPTVLME